MQIAFSLGALVPTLATTIPVTGQLARIGVIVSAVSAALLTSGYFGAVAGGAPAVQGMLRVLLGGWLAMAITYGVGRLSHSVLT